MMDYPNDVVIVWSVMWFLVAAYAFWPGRR